MAVKKITDGAYFVVDTSAYYTSVNRYDPLLANQTLVSGESADALIVEDEEYPGLDECEHDFLKQITPSHEELVKLAKKKPAPPLWIEGDEDKPF